MSEIAHEHIYAVVTDPETKGIYLPEGSLPFYSLHERAELTHESYLNTRLREHHGLISKVQRSLPPIGQSLGYHLSVVGNTRVPENVFWTPHEEAEMLLEANDHMTMLHFVRNAIARQTSVG